MEEILKELGITQKGEISKDGQYVVDVTDGDEFGKYYSILDRNDKVEELELNSLLTIHNASLSYKYKEYQISLVADYDQDVYKLIVTKFNKNKYEDDEEESEDEE